jgi:FAD/FMN-containing dehydrogenase
MSTPAFSALQAAIAGDVVLPGSARYEALRKPAIARFHHVRPQAIVRCEHPADVAETLRFAQAARLPLAVRSGGHCFAGRSSTHGLIVDVSPMAAVAVRDGLAHVGAGARLGDVYRALSRHGVTVPAGCGPTVGIAGLTLGGGLGVLGRKHGLTSDRLRSAKVVLPDGRIVHADESRHPDLFWALRGAGAAGVGVVTGLAFDTLPAPDMTSFRLTWPPSHGPAVVEAWQAWAPDAPRELAASLLVTAPADPEQPLDVTVFGALLGGRGEAAELLEQVVARVGTDPVADERRHGAHLEIKEALAAPDAPHDPGHAHHRSEFFARPLPVAAIAALLRHLRSERVTGEARELDFSPWGGAYNDPPEDATAFAHRDQRFLLKHTVTVDATAPSAGQARGRQWLERSFASTTAYGSGRVYPNFPEPGLPDAGRAYYAGNLPRLRKVQATYG